MAKIDTPLTETEVDPRLKAMVSESIRMLDELSSLTARLTAVGDTCEAAPPKATDLGKMESDLRNLQDRIAALSDQFKASAKTLDRQVRESPYLFAAAALGLGFMLGKARRLKGH